MSRPLRAAVLVGQFALCLLIGWFLIVGVVAVFGHHTAEDDPGWDCRTMGNHQCGPAPAP